MKTKNSIAGNYRELKHSQKKGYGTPLYTRYVNRKLGQILASIFAYWNISPNTITVISGIFTFSAYISFLLIPELKLSTAIFLYIVLVIGYGLDSADGLVSRLQQKQSGMGEWLDHTFDAIKIPLGHGVAFLLVLNQVEIEKVVQLLLLLILTSASALFLSNILKSKLMIINTLNNKQPRGENKHRLRSASIFRSFLLLPLDYGIFMILFLFTPFPDLFFKIYLIWGIGFILFTMLSFLKSGRELNRL